MTLFLTKYGIGIDGKSDVNVDNLVKAIEIKNNLLTEIHYVKNNGHTEFELRHLFKSASNRLTNGKGELDILKNITYIGVNDIFALELES